MVTSSLYQSYYDFDAVSGFTAKVYDHIRTLVGWVTYVKRSIVKALFLPVALCIVTIGALLFIPPFVAILLLLKVTNLRLRKAAKREKEVMVKWGYLTTRHHLDDTLYRLEKIKSLYALLQTKHNIILRVPILREIEKSIQLIEACADAYTQILESYDRPILKGFKDIVVKEEDLWNNRTQAYDYML